LNMGPHPLWQLEDLLSGLRLQPGDRVLDLACGRGATSVFLAREANVHVVAADLLIDQAELNSVLRAADVADKVTAVRADARHLPFGDDAFDAVVCIDAYEYFGTDDHYLPYLTRFLKPGGQLGIAAAAMRRDVRELGGIPSHIRACVGWEALAWHPADWWRFQWEATDLVSVTSARLQDDGWADWLLWHQVGREVRGEASGGADAVLDMLEADQGQLLTFPLVTARVHGLRVPEPGGPRAEPSHA